MSKKFFNVLTVLTISSSAWASDQFKIRGDFRFRTDNIKEEQAAPLEYSDRTRQRIRARLRTDFKVNETTDFTLRLATGGPAAADSTTSNQTLSDYSAKKGIYLDLAFARLKLNEHSSLEMGKTLNPYFAAGSQDLFIDSDLNPDGIVYNFKSADSQLPVFFTLGSFWLNERFSATGASDNTDVGLIGAQLGYIKSHENQKLTLAVSHHNFSNIKNSAAVAAKGNSTVGGNYEFDYKITIADIEFQTKTDSGTWAFYTQQAKNADPNNYNFAGLVGLRYGEAKEPGQWSISVDHREVEKDSLVGAMNDSNSSGGGTDIRSNRLTINHLIQENINIILTLYSGKKSISSQTFSPNYNRIFFDINYRF